MSFGRDLFDPKRDPIIPDCVALNAGCEANTFDAIAATPERDPFISVCDRCSADHDLRGSDPDPVNSCGEPVAFMCDPSNSGRNTFDLKRDPANLGCGWFISRREAVTYDSEPATPKRDLRNPDRDPILCHCESVDCLLDRDGFEVNPVILPPESRQFDL